jgi:hypothetical protein
MKKFLALMVFVALAFINPVFAISDGGYVKTSI